MRAYREKGFYAFSEYDGFAILKTQRDKIAKEIKNQKDDYILNVNRDEYIKHLVSEFTINPLILDKEALTVSVHEEMIPASLHPNSFLFMNSRGKSFAREVIVYHLPFSGDDELLKIRPSTYGLCSPLITVEDSCICFRIINFQSDADYIKRESSGIIKQLEDKNNYLTIDLKDFNSSIESQALQAFDTRKEQILSKNNLVASLGVPIRASTDTSPTFAVPAKRTKAIASVPKPDVKEQGYTPEPTLDNTIYSQILKMIHDVGKQFERLPATYTGKEEEHLRDHMLLMLEPNFEGSATGETFNKSGKTDILLRHEGSNVFIAELKFWHGKKGFLDTISQLLGYLTWRDSKAAIVMFVRNKEFMNVLETVKSCISEHENYLGFVKEEGEGWYHYRFHINEDNNREVKLSVMLFHIPN